MRGKTHFYRLLQCTASYGIRKHNVFLKPPIYILATGRKMFSSSMVESDIIETNEPSDEIIETKEWEPLFPKEQLVSHILKNTDASIDYGSIYNKYPNAKDTLIGKLPELRVVWEEQDCSTAFPASPEDANLDVLHYFEQKDMWERRRVLDIPKFCVGSIVAVTRGDQYSEEGFSRFVGLCIHINRHRNAKNHLFVLRNVILEQALEIQYPFYNPLIQKIEVLRHQRWENEMPGIGLRFLRDYPLQYSTVSEKMEAEPYTEEPSVRKWTNEDKTIIIKHFEDIIESRRRPTKIRKQRSKYLAPSQ